MTSINTAAMSCAKRQLLRGERPPREAPARRLGQLHAAAKALFVSVKELQAGLGPLPAVVAAAAIEINQPQSLHFDAEADDRFGPVADD